MSKNIVSFSNATIKQNGKTVLRDVSIDFDDYDVTVMFAGREGVMKGCEMRNNKIKGNLLVFILIYVVFYNFVMSRLLLLARNFFSIKKSI